MSIIETIKKISNRLLADKTVDMVIGFRDGTMPMMTSPWSAATQEEVDNFVWNSHCTMNLANYLMDRKEKIAIIAKGCDCRSVVNHIAEGKVKRDNLVIIGVPCRGMADSRILANLFGAEIDEVVETDDSFIVKSQGRQESFQREEVLRQNCRVCVHPNPVLYDELAGDPVEVPSRERFDEVERIEALDIDQRWEHFNELISTCIRCYACRDCCPTCYCPVCFVDESKPQWLGKTNDAPDVMTFHILRAFHTAGRCTDCGACASACPMGIDMRAFTKKLEKDCLDLWDWEAGLENNVRPALETFKPEDPEDNIK